MRRVDLKRFSRELMGKPVRFFRVYRRVTTNVPDEKTWEARNLGPGERSTGWIVGLRWLCTGRRIQGSRWSSTLGDDYDPPTFRETKPRILVYLVAPLPNARPVFVPPGAVELLAEEWECEFVDQSTKKFLSEDSKNWPRDLATGQFVALASKKEP